MKEVSAQVYLRLVGWGEGLEKGVLKPEKGGSPRERTPRGGTQGRAPRGRGWWWCGSSGQGAFRLMGVEVGPQGRVPRGQGRGRGGASGREPRGQGGGVLEAGCLKSEGRGWSLEKGTSRMGRGAWGRVP